MWRDELGAKHPLDYFTATRYPWVMTPATDFVQQVGVPRYGNDQVFVAADAGMPWDSMNAKQRQNVSLALGATSIIGLYAAVRLAETSNKIYGDN